MVLYVVRHADALPVGGLIRRDAERPLSPRGEQDAELMGEALARIDGSIGMILSSPLLRATQTAEVFQKSAGGGITIRTSENLAPGFRPKSLLEELKRLKTLPAVVVIGHQPDLGNLITFLISGNIHAGIAVPACAVARISLESDDLSGAAVLQWLVTPQAVRAARVPSGRTNP